jgi:argininosuccinate synthase
MSKLKEICWDRATHKLASTLSREYADLIYDGFWHSDARYSIEAFFAQASEPLSGTITLGVHPHQLECLQRESPWSLYNSELVSFEKDASHLNARADGFCKMLAVRQNAQGLRARRLGRELL